MVLVPLVHNIQILLLFLSWRIISLEHHSTPPNVKTPPTVNASNDAEIPNIKPWCFVTRGCLKYERGKGLPSGYVKIAIENGSLFRGFPL